MKKKKKMDKSAKTIRICASHEEEYPTPLLGTIAFHFYEKWCPYCGENGDIFYGETIPSTPQLEVRKQKYKEASKEYLDALITLNCKSLVWKGKRISPCALPQEEKERLQAIVAKGWKTGIKAEDL